MSPPRQQVGQHADSVISTAGRNLKLFCLNHYYKDLRFLVVALPEMTELWVPIARPRLSVCSAVGFFYFSRVIYFQSTHTAV